MNTLQTSTSFLDEPRPQRVMVVDDDPAIHHLVRARLKDESLDIVSVFLGSDALPQIIEQQPDLILLDIDMPDMSGLDVCRQIKGSAATMQIPVIFLTGADSMEDKVTGLDLGAVDYVTKPFNPIELRARVRAALRTKFVIDLLAQKAMIDGLTGLWNRGFLDQTLATQIAHAQRNGTPFSLIICDVDHFKLVNDRFGHPVGDDVLRSVARVMRRRVRSSDSVCRYGGEEFVIIASGATAEQTEMLAEDVRRLIEATVTISGRPEVRVTASLGVAQYDGNGATDLLRRADEALYAAKQAGRNTVVTSGQVVPAAKAA